MKTEATESSAAEAAAPTLAAVTLSPRERECLNLLAEGYSAKRMAAKLGISTRTIEKHVRGLKRRLRAKTVTQAVVIGLRLIEGRS